MKNTRILSVIAISILFIMANGIASASGINKIITGYNTANLPNNSIRVYITATGMDNIAATGMDNIADITLNFDYNSDVITLKEIHKGDILSTGTTLTTDTNTTGTITIEINNSAGIAESSASGAIVDMRFNVVGNRDDSSPLNVNNLKVLDRNNNDITSNINISNTQFVVGKGMGTIIGPVETTVMSTPTETTPEVTSTETPSITETTTETATETTIPPPTETPKSPGFALVSSIVAIALVFLKRKKINKK